MMFKKIHKLLEPRFNSLSELALYSQQKKMLRGKVECDGVPTLFLSSVELLEIAKPKALHCELSVLQCKDDMGETSANYWCPSCVI